MEKDTNPKDAIGTKKWRQFMVVPRQVLWEVGVGMLEGSLKYGRHNYRASGVRASVYCDAALGHIEQFIEGEDIDKDSGLSHVTKAICSLVVLRDAMMNDFWTDDRPPKIKNLDDLRARLQKVVEENFERYKDKSPHHYTEEVDGAPYREVELWTDPKVIIDEAVAIDPKWFDAVAQDVQPETPPTIPGREAVWMTRDEIRILDAMLKSGEMARRIEDEKKVGPEVKELTTRDLEIGKSYRAYRLPNGELIQWDPAMDDREDVEPWFIIDKRKVDGMPLAVKRSWLETRPKHKGAPLSSTHTWVEVENWNATAADVQDEKVLAIASGVFGTKTIGPAEAVEARLAETSYLPMSPVSELGRDDPETWLKDHPSNPEYDRKHVFDVLTQAQLDRLVRAEAQRCGVHVSEAPSDTEMWNAVCRRVLLRLMSRLPLWHRIDFAMGGTDRRFSRLRGEEWFVAIPGCRVTPDAAPRSFA